MRGAGYGIELPCSCKEINFRATGLKKSLKRKKANCNRNDYVLSGTVCDETVKNEPISLDIREDILDPVDPE